jgi:hypothetical protein
MLRYFHVANVVFPEEFEGLVSIRVKNEGPISRQMSFFPRNTPKK